MELCAIKYNTFDFYWFDDDAIFDGSYYSSFYTHA